MIIKNPMPLTKPHSPGNSVRETGTAWFKSERGASLVEMSLIVPFLGLLLLGVIDFGRAFYLSIEVQNAAEAGALYGSQNPTDTTGIESAATTDAPDVSGMTVTTSSGCECNDGTLSASPCPTPAPACPVNVVNYVQVTTAATYTPWLHTWLIPGLPSSMNLKGSAKLRQ